jgi:hypothetical protein
MYENEDLHSPYYHHGAGKCTQRKLFILLNVALVLAVPLHSVVVFLSIMAQKLAILRFSKTLLIPAG